MGHLSSPACCLLLTLATPVTAQVVFDSGNDSGHLPVFVGSSAESVMVGDSGSLNAGLSRPPVPLGRITLRLSTFSAAIEGTTDIEFKLHDGDPSGLGPGSGDVLYATTLVGVRLESAAFPPDATYFDLSIPLPNVMTRGGANHVGWSVRCRNFRFGGELGFQVGSCASQYAGTGTRKAAWFNGSIWSQFDFGPDPCNGWAQLSARIERAASCFGDLDSSTRVDAGDLSLMLLEFGPCAGCPSDVDGSGAVDGGDLSLLLLEFGACP